MAAIQGQVLTVLNDHGKMDSAALSTCAFTSLIAALEELANALDEFGDPHPVDAAIAASGLKDDDCNVTDLCNKLAHVYSNPDPQEFLGQAKTALVGPESGSIVTAMRRSVCSSSMQSRQTAQDTFVLMSVVPLLTTGFTKALWYFDLDDVRTAAVLLGIPEQAVIKQRLFALLLFLS